MFFLFFPLHTAADDDDNDDDGSMFKLMFVLGDKNDISVDSLLAV